VHKLFTHENQLKEELEKLQVKLGIAEEAEKEAIKVAPESSEEKNSEKKDDDKSTDTTPSHATASSAPQTNGVHEKVKLVNGDVSVDSDTTAVNTPLGSSTPLPKLEAVALSATETTESDANVLKADVLRVQTLHLQKLLNFLEKEFAPTRQRLNDLLASNDMKFSLLWCLFRLGSVITFKDYDSGLNMAGEVYSFL